VSEQLYEQFALIGKALSAPHRIQLLDLLCQGERSVEQLAVAADLQIANTSAHLQILRRARLVEVRRAKHSIYYRLADDEVARFFLHLRELSRTRSAEVQHIVDDFRAGPGELTPVRQDELLGLLTHGEIVVIDVRPVEEYASGHIPGAISMPLDVLPARLSELPMAKDIVAYCRGPYCVMAPQAVTLLRDRGYPARRMEDGFPEWRLAGRSVAASEKETR
jgi:rhodanese-related sulfurtransferase